MTLELHLDLGYLGGNTGRGTKFLIRFLVPGKSSCSGNRLFTRLLHDDKSALQSLVCTRMIICAVVTYSVWISNLNGLVLTPLVYLSGVNLFLLALSLIHTQTTLHLRFCLTCIQLKNKPTPNFLFLIIGLWFFSFHRAAGGGAEGAGETLFELQ